MICLAKYLTLTESDRLILESYKVTMDGLSQYLGEGYELILHSLEDLEHSVIKIINGHYTGRVEGAPIISPSPCWIIYEKKKSLRL